MRPIFLLLLFQCMLNSVSAQITFSRLQQVLNYADTSSFTAKQNAVKEKINTDEEGLVRSGLLPKINIYSTADYYPVIASQVIPDKIFGGASDAYTKVQFGLPLNFSGGVELSMPVINFEKWEQLKTTRLQTIAGKWNSKTNIENLHIQLTQYYYRALLFKQLIELNDANENVMNELMRMIEERRKNNILNPADYNRSQNLSVEIANAGLEYRKNYQLALNQLQYLLNTGTVPQLTEQIANTGWDILTGEDTTITNRAAWNESVAQVAVAKQLLTAANKSSLPKISLNSKYAYQWQMKPGSNSQQIGFDVSSIGLRLDLPLFAGNYSKLLQKKTESQLQSVQIQQQQVQGNLVQQQTEWQINYNTALTRQQQLHKKMQFAKDNLRIANLSFKEGVMEYDEYNNIFREHIQAQIENLQNIADGLIYKLLLNLNKPAL
ncbi:MAG: TolC family protein [Panacibacter sp.]